MFTKSILLTAISLTFLTSLFAQNSSTMKNINNDAPVKCSKTIAINASSERVWGLMADINNWSAWQTEISNPQLNGDLQPESTFDWKSGGAKIHSTLHTVEPLSKMGWTGKAFGMLAIHNWTITEQDGVTIVNVEESMEGFFAKLLKKSFNKSLESGMQTWLELLKEESEK